MSFSPGTNRIQHQLIDLQNEIDKLHADLEFYEQKIRIISHELEYKEEKLSTINRRLATLRRLRSDRERGPNEN